MLTQQIIKVIKTRGPMRVDHFMHLALCDPDHGYYAQRQVFGAEGDFTTAPEISQIFGEICAAYIGSAMASYRNHNGTDDIALVELGPGRGVLMSDILRTLKSMGKAYQPSEILMVESSMRLQHLQRQKLGDEVIRWHETIDALPPMPCIIIANEFFDALPIRQAIFTDGNWHERVINVEGSDLVFATGKMRHDVPTLSHMEVKEGTIYEYSEVAKDIMERLSIHLSTYGGMAVIIDYGYMEHLLGDTLQAVKQHQYVSVLNEVGHADITAHVNFAMLREIAEAQGLKVQAFTTQGKFLRELGADIRALALCKNASDMQKAEILSALDRLMSFDKMGALFKVLVVSSSDMPIIHQFL